MYTHLIFIFRCSSHYSYDTNNLSHTKKKRKTRKNLEKYTELIKKSIQKLRIAIWCVQKKNLHQQNKRENYTTDATAFIFNQIDTTYTEIVWLCGPLTFDTLPRLIH